MQTTNETQVLDKVKSLLEKKYTKISDLEIYVYPESHMRVGFDFMNYDGTPSGRYAFHETNFRFDMTEMRSVDEIFNYFDKSIQNQLIWQKANDESYAKEFNKPLNYKYDYSLIDA